MKLIIDIKVVNLERAVEFYVRLLGLKLRRQENEWAALQVGDAEIHLYLEGGVTGNVEFYVENIDTEVARLSAQGIVFTSGSSKPHALKVSDTFITEFPWGRIAFFHDSEGNELALVEDHEK